MTRRLIALCVASLCGFAIPAAADDNVLLGRWHYNGQGFVDGQGHNWCGTAGAMAFAADRRSVVTTADGCFPSKTTVPPAYYAIYGDTIFVSTRANIVEGTQFTVIDRNHIQDDMVGHCVYERK